MPTKHHVPLSILDLATVSEGSTSAAALADTAQLARRAESLGYTRFWVAEHHNMPTVASTTPPVLIAHLAAVTATIRVGSGGVMLPNHPPLVVAEQFAMLEALYPGRFDHRDRPRPWHRPCHRRRSPPFSRRPRRRGVPPTPA